MPIKGMIYAWSVGGLGGFQNITKIMEKIRDEAGREYILMEI